MSFNAGDLAYTIRGAKVEVLSVSSDGYVVMRVDPAGDRFGQPKIIRSLFVEPPVSLYDEQIRQKKSELEKLRAEISEANREKQELDNRKWKLIAKLTEQVNVLSGIADWIDGKVTHVVVVSEYGDVSVREIDQLECDSSRNTWRKQIKLMTLFGDSDGSLTWKMNKYYDGSGSWCTVYLFSSEDEAKAKASQVIQEWEVADKEGYVAGRLIDSANSLGIVPPERLLRAASAYRLAECQREIASINERRAKVAKDFPELFQSGLVNV